MPDRVPAWKTVARRLALLLLVAAACASLVIPLNQLTSDRTRTLDFANFCMAGTIVRQGQSRRLYDFRLQQKIESEISPGGPFQPYYHPPFEALLFVPFAAFSYPYAFLLWGLTNLVLLVLIVYLLRFTGYRLGTGTYVVWIAICLFFALATLALGQDTLLLALVFLLAFLALKRRRDFAAGLVLGLGLFRFEILLPFVFVFFLRRRWKLLAGFAAVGAVELLVSAALVGWSGLERYVRTLVEVGSAAGGPWADRSGAAMMPSLRGALEALLGGVMPHRFLFPLILAGTLVLLGWAAWELKSTSRPDNPAFDLEFCLVSIAALLASYHLFVSELTPLIVVGWLILAYEGMRGRTGILRDRWGTALLLLILGVIVGEAVIHSRDFSVEVAVLLGLMVWLSRQLSALRKSAAVG